MATELTPRPGKMKRVVKKIATRALPVMGLGWPGGDEGSQGDPGWAARSFGVPSRSAWKPKPAADPVHREGRGQFRRCMRSDVAWLYVSILRRANTP